MKLSRCLCLASLIASGFIGWTSLAYAQQPARGKTATNVSPARTTTTPTTSLNLEPPVVTPELWLYSQEQRRHDDPALAVRRKAEARTAARMQRIEAMKWFGLSNARPQASVTPMMGTFSPSWVGNGWDRYDWVGVGAPATALRVESYEYNLRR
jgi:hypothetical protein